jgi:hypothetical protein
MNEDEKKAEIYRAENQSNITNATFRHERRAASFAFAAETSMKATQAALIMNGGASLAMLTFLGSLVTNNKDGVENFAVTLVCYVAGLLCVVVATGLRYLAQIFFHKVLDYSDRDDPIDSTKERCFGLLFSRASIFLVVASYLIFSLGTIRAYCGFLELQSGIAYQ